MRNFILFRVALLVPVVLVATMVIFAIVQLAPGDPAQAVAGRFASKAEVDKLAEELGFTDHIVKQYVRWLGNAVTGDLGISLEEKSPVFPILMDTFMNTLILGAASGFLAVLFGIIFGVISALKQNSIFDRLILFVSLFGLSMPAYWLGLVLIFLLVVKVQWFPSFGMYSPVGGGGVVDLLRHLALPAVAGSTVAMGIIARVTRSAMLEVLNQDFITGLRAKGLSEPAIWKHAFRNALPPGNNYGRFTACLSLVGLPDFCRDHIFVARDRSANFYCGFQPGYHHDSRHSGVEYSGLRFHQLACRRSVSHS